VANPGSRNRGENRTVTKSGEISENLLSSGRKSIMIPGGFSMKQASKWNIRQMKCPEGRGRAELLLEWKVEKGRKVLHSISCDNLQLAHYSGVGCQWFCLEKVSGKK
jgi:hypothetical protein